MALFLCGALQGQSEQRAMPEFSWDTLPLYMHVRKATAFSDEEFRFLSKFPLITLEKSNGHKTYGSVDAGCIEAGKGIKALNPKAKVLFYRNVIVHYGGYSFDKQLEEIPGWYLEGKNGKDKLVRGQVRAYDLSNKELRKWWVDTMAGICKSPSIDGLFLDGNVKVLTSYLANELPKGKKAAVTEGYREMMDETRKALGQEKLMVANVIRARFDDAGLEFMDYFDGSYLEAFSHEVGKMDKAEYMAKGIAAVQKAARDEKIIALTLGIGESSLGDGIDESQGGIESFDAASQERLDFNIALFLIMAEKYSYLMVSDGYGVDPGKDGKSQSKLWLHTFPEYDRPLGAPKSPAVKDGMRYTREFEHVSVSLDLDTMKGDLIWK
ncbi:MAG: putative glycoside hydrolase [Luteolibacter sp.]